MQPITYYNNIKKENKRMLNEIIKNNKKQERKDLIKILKYLTLCRTTKKTILWGFRRLALFGPKTS